MQFAYEHKHEHQLQLVGIEDMPFLKGVDDKQIFQNVKILKETNLIKVWDAAWRLISITTHGILLVENRPEFDRRFQIVSDETKPVDELKQSFWDKYFVPIVITIIGSVIAGIILFFVLK